MISTAKEHNTHFQLPNPKEEFYTPLELELILKTEELDVYTEEKIYEILSVFDKLDYFYYKRYGNLNYTLQAQLPEDIKRDIVEIGFYSGMVWCFGKSLNQLQIMFNLLESLLLEAIENNILQEDIFIDLEKGKYEPLYTILNISGLNSNVYLDDPFYSANLKINLMNLRAGMLHCIIQKINIEAQKFFK